MTTIEEELGAAKPETMPSQTSKETKLTAKVERPAPILRRGTGGRDVNVGTNYVRLELDDGNVSSELFYMVGRQLADRT